MFSAAMNAYAKEEWQHIAPELHRLNLLTVLDVGPLAAYCCAAAQLRQQQGAIERMAKQDRRGHALTIEATRAIKSRIHCCVSRRQWPDNAAHRLGIRAYAKRTTPSFRGQAVASAVEIRWVARLAPQHTEPSGLQRPVYGPRVAESARTGCFWRKADINW
jgi:hypothetical protein